MDANDGGRSNDKLKVQDAAMQTRFQLAVTSSPLRVVSFMDEQGVPVSQY